WMHANMLTMNGQRMSKSTGNYILPMQLITGENNFFEKAFSPAILRFCFLQAHYRSVLDISNEAMLASEKGFQRLMEAVENVTNLPVTSNSSFNVQEWKQKCYDSLNDDFNSPILTAHLFDAVKNINAIQDGKETITENDKQLLAETLNAFVFDVLGLFKDRKSTRLNSSHVKISYAVFCLKKKKIQL